MLTEKDYCDYETCVALKELGIIECSLQYYEKGCPNTLHRNLLQPLTIRTAEAFGRVLAISLYNAQKWLREEKCIHVVPELGLIYRDKNGLAHYYRVLVKDMNSGIIRTLDNDRDDFESYEEALSKGIKEAVKILKEETNDQKRTY